MAQTNITTEQQQIELREIKRNSSKQIVSYTLEEDSQREYGYHKVKGNTTLYDRDIYNRTIETLSNELITPLPDIPLEIIEQQFINEGDIYINGVSIRSNNPEESEFEDTFSGRYELTLSAASARKNKNQGWDDNTHYSGIGYWNGDVRNDTEDFINFEGYKEILWDNAVFGPALDNGGYRITQELIDSGKNLNLRSVIGFSLRHTGGDTVSCKVRINRKRIPNERIFTVGTEETTNSGVSQYPMIEVAYDVLNEDMRLGDIYEIQTEVSSRNRGTFIYGDKCIFLATAWSSEIEQPYWPNTGVSAGTGNPFAPSEEAEAEEVSNDTRS